MKKILLLATFAGFAFSSTAKDISFGLEATFAPFEFYNDKNELVGFDIDIANKICETLQYNCKFVNQSFDSLIPSLKTRRIDASIAGIDITPERMKEIDFTQPYFATHPKFITQKGHFSSIDELKGHKIGVQNGSTQQKYLIDQDNMDIVSYDSYQYAVLDLKSGRIDAIFVDSVVGDEWLVGQDETKTPILAQVGEEITDPNYFGSGLAIAVRKGNPNLLNDLNSALDKMKEDGSYAEIHHKWFSK